MNNLVWSNRFVRAVKKASKNNPMLLDKIYETTKLLEENIFHTLLHTHKLQGNFSDNWACTVSYDHRIVFSIEKNEKSKETDILLLSFGTHDEVY
jgi:addiction module RelE/StbE family toxin